MATTYKVLGQVKSNTSAATLYTVPSATAAVCSSLIICNLGESTLYRVAVRPSGVAIEDKHYVVYNAAVNQYDSVCLTLGITMGATDVMTVFASTSSVSFNLFGSEIA
jgi:hypothetical protein